MVTPKGKMAQLSSVNALTPPSAEDSIPCEVMQGSHGYANFNVVVVVDCLLQAQAQLWCPVPSLSLLKTD